MASLAVLPAPGATADQTPERTKASGRLGDYRHSKVVLHLRFHDSAQVVLEKDAFVSQSGADIDEVNALLDDKAVSKRRLFAASYEAIKRERESIKAAKGITTPDLNSHFRVSLREAEDIDALVVALRSAPHVEEAYAEPLAVRPPATPDYASLQSHFDAAPSGLGVRGAGVYPGAKGGRVAVADVEYSWNTAHEDLSKLRRSDALIANGTPTDPLPDNGSHGTAVTGVIAADLNGYGVSGIVPDAQLYGVNAHNRERNWDVANAIYMAQTRLSAGDVLLLEQQADGPAPGNQDYVPVEWWPPIYDAIRTVTAQGIHVVEAAGNGRVNLDADPALGSPFPHGKPDSGAIIVGAGAACNRTDQHSRLPSSTYGRRVDVQGHGECVVSAGYGDLNREAGLNAWYTDRFAGTSSASALLGAVVVSVSSSYETQKGVALSPVQVRDLLKRTGTAQAGGPSDGNIGPLPNLAAAIREFSPAPDTTAPETTITSGPAATSSSSNATFEFSSSEAGSTFECKLDAGEWAPCSSPKALSGLADGLHSFSVRARDAAGNTDASEATRSFTVDLSASPPPDSDEEGVPNAPDQCSTPPGSSARADCPAPAPTRSRTPAATLIVPPTTLSNVFSSIGKARVKRRLTILTLLVPGPGVVKAAQAGTTDTSASASKPLVKPVHVTALGVGELKLRIRPSKAGMRRLRKKKSFSVGVEVTYTPKGGTSRSLTKRVKLKR